MHPSVMEFLRENVKREEIEGARVLEIGSIFWDVGPRDIIMPCKPGLYIGIDERPGKGVDEVMSANNLSNRFEESWFDVVICTEVLEHAKDWRGLLEQIHRVLKPNGILYLTCRGGDYPYHEEPNDYWRFSKEELYRAFSYHYFITQLRDDPQFPGVFMKALKRYKNELPEINDLVHPYALSTIHPKAVYPPFHHMNHNPNSVPEDIKFTIITPTILRPSLKKACRRLESQIYSNWEHIVMIDNPDAEIPTWLPHPQRTIIKCAKVHNDVGNSCRHEAYPHITGDYVLYLDDDNYYHSRTLSLLAEGIYRLNRPNWGVFPMQRLGRKFFNVPPGRNLTDTGQFFHKPVIGEEKIQYFAIKDYAADGAMVEWLTRISSPAIVDASIPLINMPVRSFGIRNDIPTTAIPDAYSVVIPNRYEDIIGPLLSSIQVHEPAPLPNIIIVGDNHRRDYGYAIVPVYSEKFCFSRNANAGIRRTDPDDVILVNDDIRLIMPVFRQLYEIMQKYPDIGILTPLIDGGVGNPKQMPEKVLTTGVEPPELTYSACTKEDFLTFPFVYLRRKMLDEIQFNESFVSYGKDDGDFCIRAAERGWKAAVYNRLVVRHGIGGSEDLRGLNWNSSFMRRPELIEGADIFSKIHK